MNNTLPIQIVNFLDHPGALDEAVRYYHSKWGRASNYSFFYDAVRHSSNSDRGLPRFYLMLYNDRIIGCAALVTNDFISRHDLMPWLAGLYIEADMRGQELGYLLMQYLEKEALRIGYQVLYLTTDHDGYYEKYGWIRIADAHEPDGAVTRVYMKNLE